jgi:hypothetical protein
MWVRVNCGVAQHHAASIQVELLQLIELPPSGMDPDLCYLSRLRPTHIPRGVLSCYCNLFIAYHKWTSKWNAWTLFVIHKVLRVKALHFTFEGIPVDMMSTWLIVTFGRWAPLRLPHPPGDTFLRVDLIFIEINPTFPSFVCILYNVGVGSHICAIVCENIRCPPEQSYLVTTYRPGAS